MLLDTRSIQFINAFEQLTGVRTGDCFEAEGFLVFLVKKGEFGRAIGRRGSNISKVQKKFGRRILVFEDFDNISEFTQAACRLLNVSTDLSDRKLRVKIPRGEREGISGKQIRVIKELLKRRFDLEEVEFIFT